MKTIQDDLEVRHFLDSAEGYISLGLLDLADAEVRRAVVRFGESQATLAIKEQIACAQADYAAIESIARAKIDTSSDPVSELHAISISGDPAWVYSRCLALENDFRKNDLYWFNRACFACLVGKLPDALAALCRSFCLSPQYHAMAFIDPDLEPLWGWILNVPLNDGMAELLAHPIWRRSIRNQAENAQEIEISPLMKASVPEQFQRFLVPAQTMLKASEIMPTSFYREYLEWQKSITQIRADALNDASSRARTYLRGRQLRFALKQLKLGNVTAARYHVLHHLALRPHELSRLRYLKHLGMGYLLDDIKTAVVEDPHFVGRVEAVGRPWFTSRCSDDGFEEIRKAGQETTLFQMRLACHELDNGREQEGIRRLLGVLSRWPQDATPYSRLVDAYIRLERWEEARLCFQAAPAHYRQFYWYRQQWSQIQQESTELVVDIPFTTQFVGQRDLGGLLINPESSNARGGE